MPNLSDSVRERIEVFVQEVTSRHTDWKVNADYICRHIEQGKLLSPKDIRYENNNGDGPICRINKLELKDGLLQLKEPPPAPKVIKHVNTTVHPFIEELRSRNSASVDPEIRDAYYRMDRGYDQ